MLLKRAQCTSVLGRQILAALLFCDTLKLLRGRVQFAFNDLGGEKSPPFLW
jgi:hypothetical protein